MVDFKKLLGDRVPPPKPPQILLKAERTNPNSETTTEVEVALWIKTLPQSGERWAQLEGGPTGYESFILSDENIRRGWERGWVACMGSKSAGASHAGYDRLVIPWAELLRFYAWAGIEEPS